MATKAAASSGRKRKQSSEHSDAVAVPDLLQDVGLEMLSEDEGATESVQCSDSDDGEVEEFPEINASSSEEDEEDEDEEDGEESEGENSNDTDDLSPFPKPKTIISDITGQPKRVYPAIEADYDSDSSTEDVGAIELEGVPFWPYDNMTTGSQSRRTYTYALVRRYAAYRL